MTALELHRQNPSLEFAPMLRVIKYMGFDSNDLTDDDVGLILRLYPDFEHDPELVVGVEAVCRQAEIDAEQLTRLLEKHRDTIPFLGTVSHPMVPTVAIGMIRAISRGQDPYTATSEELLTLTDIAACSDISLASLSKYVKEHPERIPSRRVGKMRKFPPEAVAVFQQIKLENLGRRGGGKQRAARQKAALSKRYATKFAELEEQVEAAAGVAKELSKTLKRLTRKVRSARQAAENGSKVAASGQSTGARRSGGQRPDTIVAACKRVLADATEPMRVADVTERVIAMDTPIRAKNPNVTISSILSSYDDFRRVRRGYYELAKPSTPDVGENAGSSEPPVADRASSADSPGQAPRGGGSSEATSTASQSELERAVASTIDQDPGDVLEGLRAAVDAG